LSQTELGEAAGRVALAVGRQDAAATQHGGHVGSPLLSHWPGAERAGPAEGRYQAKVDGSHYLDSHFK
jgi:hypothetical protein